MKEPTAAAMKAARKIIDTFGCFVDPTYEQLTLEYAEIIDREARLPNGINSSRLVGRERNDQ